MHLAQLCPGINYGRGEYPPPPQQIIVIVVLFQSHFRYTPYEVSNLANQNSRKLGVFNRKLEGSHSLFHSHFDKYYRK